MVLIRINCRAAYRIGYAYAIENLKFPFPFEDELLVDEERGLLLSTGQALYDYDTMWQLLEENYPYLEAIKREMGIDWEEVKREYRQRLESHASDGYISQEDFIHTIDVCLKKFPFPRTSIIRCSSSEMLEKNSSSVACAPSSNSWRFPIRV